MIDQTEVQSLVLRPRAAARIDVAFLRCPTREHLRALMATAADAVTSTAMADPTRPAVNVGITGAGIALADIRSRTHAALPATFARGMRAAATRLGDVGASSPHQWAAPFGPGDGPVHAVAIAVSAAVPTEPWPTDREPAPGWPDPQPVDAPTAPDWLGLADHVAGLGDQVATWTGVRLGFPSVDGAVARSGVEPFGFRDDVTNPVIAGSGDPVTPGNGIWDATAKRWRAVRAGEAVLGHVDESGVVAGHPDAANLERDGSYLVIRKLEQHVDTFRATCLALASDAGLTAQEVAARIVGRHPDGRALGQAPGEAPTNDFLYRDGGPQSRAVRPSSHIRRSNPRDDLEEAAAIVPRHLLFRRGIPYREATEGGACAEGLLFLAVCADIRRQFEFVQSHWLQDGNRFGFGLEPDGLTGARDAGGSDEGRALSFPRADGSRARCPAIPRFVTSRGGEYVLLPSRSALRRLGDPEQTL